MYTFNLSVILSKYYLSLKSYTLIDSFIFDVDDDVIDPLPALMNEYWLAKLFLVIKKSAANIVIRDIYASACAIIPITPEGV